MTKMPSRNCHSLALSDTMLEISRRVVLALELENCMQEI